MNKKFSKTLANFKDSILIIININNIHSNQNNNNHKLYFSKKEEEEYRKDNRNSHLI